MFAKLVLSNFRETPQATCESSKLSLFLQQACLHNMGIHRSPNIFLITLPNQKCKIFLEKNPQDFRRAKKPPSL
jgi:hypothetical protein